MQRAAITTTDLPPNIEGGTPAPGGTVWVRYTKAGAKWWVEPYLYFAGEQTHLSTLDLGDRRTGAGRTRGNIQNFFRNGARARGWINRRRRTASFGNADDILIATGETLAQVQDRVLGVGVNSAPLFTAVKGYATFGVRFGCASRPARGARRLSKTSTTRTTAASAGAWMHRDAGCRRDMACGSELTGSTELTG